MTIEQSGSLPLQELSDDQLASVLVDGPDGKYVHKARSADVAAHHEELLRGPEDFPGDRRIVEEYVRRLAERWLPELEKNHG